MNNDRFVLYAISATTLGLIFGVIGGLSGGVWGQLVGTLAALVLASPVTLIWHNTRQSEMHAPIPVRS